MSSIAIVKHQVKFVNTHVSDWKGSVPLMLNYAAFQQTGSSE